MDILGSVPPDALRRLKSELEGEEILWAGRPAPRLGQDGAALLAAAGMTEAEIAALKRDGVLHEAPQ